jgi:methylmalonyl-CoA/ethylmalonyl-CoA epimerase
MSTPAAGFTLSEIGQIAVPVSDINRAVAFYRDTLGMRFLFQFGNLAFFDCAGVRLLLDVPEKPEFRQHSSVIYYKVSDIQAAHGTLTLRGVDFEDKPHVIAKMPDHDLWMTFFRDPDQNLLALMSEVRR